MKMKMDYMPFTNRSLKISLMSYEDLSQIRRGFKERRTGRTPPPPPKIFKDKGTRGYINMYIMTNVHVSRSVLMSQLLTCLSLAILFLIMQTLQLLGRSVFWRWLDHNSKCPKFSALSVY